MQPGISLQRPTCSPHHTAMTRSIAAPQCACYTHVRQQMHQRVAQHTHSLVMMHHRRPSHHRPRHLAAVNQDVTGTLPSEEHPHPSLVAPQKPPNNAPPEEALPFSWDLVAIALGAHDSTYRSDVTCVPLQCMLCKGCWASRDWRSPFSSRTSSTSNQPSWHC